MEKLTVLQLSKRTGLSRTQIYHLQTKNKLKIINGKIDFEEAMPAIIELLDKKSNKDSEINFKQILNLLISQNISLQTQLNFAHEREKEYLAELTIYRQHYAQKTVQNPPKFKGNTQIELENNVVDTNENYQNQMQSKIENQAHLKSYQSINKQTKSVNEVESKPTSTESIYNEMNLPESKSLDTRPKNESTEQNAGALIRRTIPTQDDTKLLLNIKRQRKPKAQLVKLRTKNVSIIPTSHKSDSTLINKSIADQDSLDKKDHHDYEQ
ncbi:hypothetical protein I5729_00520 [Acinetobacter bereziniae]|uniref:hypothetical protein n=1 Tax=Acinetobacter bereziniae TaxID=106648 RepID=UPI00190020A2|nr:hypothetical protein [Acinetobacter bereziniae]MBJ9947600.1 hypothetical protein [Acinetobacter bereziniae]